jgi:hypothetical protein
VLLIFEAFEDPARSAFGCINLERFLMSLDKEEEEKKEILLDGFIAD